MIDLAITRGRLTLVGWWGGLRPVATLRELTARAEMARRRARADLARARRALADDSSVDSG